MDTPNLVPAITAIEHVGVTALARIKLIVALPTNQRIVPEPTFEGVVVVPAIKNVIAALGSGARRAGRATTGTRIRPDAPENPPQRDDLLAV